MNMIRFSTVSSLALFFAAAGCADQVAPAGHPCPCAADNVCCPSGVCAPDKASCAVPAAASPAPAAPAALTFTRQSASLGQFTWDAVPGASSYALFIDGVQVQTTTKTSVSAEIGNRQVEARVAALNETGSSPKSEPFPLLFDVSVRACTSDTVETRWRTQRATDTQLSIERTGENTIACTDPTLRQEHTFGNAAECSQMRVPMGTGGRLKAGSNMTVNLLSRDEQGFLGKYQQAFVMPPVACLCATSSKATDDSGCNPVLRNAMLPQEPPITYPPCAVGFDLENGKLVTDVSQADVFMRATETEAGALTEARLVAPKGVALLSNKMFCDVLEAPESGYNNEIPVHTADSTSSHGLLPERSTVFVVKTRNGRYAKLNLDFNGPGGFLASGAGIGAAGIRFMWSLAPAGSTAFPD